MEEFGPYINILVYLEGLSTSGKYFGSMLRNDFGFQALEA